MEVLFFLEIISYILNSVRNDSDEEIEQKVENGETRYGGMWSNISKTCITRETELIKDRERVKID